MAQHQPERTVTVTREVQLSAEQIEERKRLEEERKRQLEIEKERRRQERINACRDSISQDFQQHLKTSSDFLPPEIMAVEELNFLEEYLSVEKYRYGTGFLGLDEDEQDEALSRFIDSYDYKKRSVSRLKLKVRARLQIARFTCFGYERAILSKAEVSTRPTIKVDSRNKTFSENTIFVAQQKEEAERNDEGSCPASVTIFVDEGAEQVHIQICSPAVGSIYITLPGTLNPTELAERILTSVSAAISQSCGDAEPILILNGDISDLCAKSILKSKKLIYRTRSVNQSVYSVLPEKIKRLAQREPLTNDNTKIISGLPNTQTHLEAIFSESPDGIPDWDDWSDVSKLWTDTASSNSFDVESLHSSEEFVKALKEEENVIVLVAHADSHALYFPIPEPGSSVTVEDIMSHSEAIKANNPVVFLFCCETAQFPEGLVSITDALLKAGALSVVSAQTKVGLYRSQKMFKRFLKNGKKMNPLRALTRAENSANYREMENWIV
nr:CHAT domain-containing protein [uncultured Ruegeria sp.]